MAILALTARSAAAQVPPGPGKAEPRGAISGIITDEMSAPVAGAQVHYTRVRNAHRDTYGRWVFDGPMVQSWVTTDARGLFKIAKLFGGLYALCVIGPRREHLMTCDWGERYVHATVREGQETSGVAVRVRNGVVLRFLVSDPLARFGASPSHEIGVFSSRGVYKRAPLRSRQAGAAEFSVTVPKRSQFQVYVRAFTGLTDLAGRPLPVGAPALAITTGEEAEQMVQLVVR